MNNIIEERNRILNIFKKYPQSQGKRPDWFPPHKEYSRLGEISKELGINGLKGKTLIPKLEMLINNDFENCIYTFGIIVCSWKIHGIYKTHQDQYFHIDIKNGGEICDKIFKGEIVKLEDAVNQIILKYKLNHNNYLYLVKLKDECNHRFTDKKIGITKNINDRLKQMSVSSPFDYEVVSLWEIEVGRETEIEKILHNKFSHIRKRERSEWFFDYHNDLLEQIRDVLKDIKGIHIKEIEPSSTVKYSYNIKDFLRMAA